MSTLIEAAPARVRSRGLALLALLLLVPMTSLGEGVALWIWPGTALGIGVYWLAKVWVAALPALWLRYVERQAWSWSPARRGGFGAALVLGLLIAGVMIGAYAIVLHNRGIDVATMRAVAAKNHLDIWWVYAGFVLVISSLNALMEEYVWRWFVYRQCLTLVPAGRGWAAVGLAAVLFTLHHTSALKVYFDWPVTVLGSVGVFLGGVMWSAMYRRYQSVWPGFVCHILADLAMFGIGAHLIFAA